MSVAAEPHLDVKELRGLLEAADPATLLVPSRLLRRVIKHDCRLTGLGLQVPHHLSYVIDRVSLLQIVTHAELGEPAARGLAETLQLISAPEIEELRALSRAQALLKYWRISFHIRVHQAIRTRFERGRLSPALLRERIHRIGQTEFAEIRTVLRQERYLLPPASDHTVYEEFAALYLELNYFDPALLPRYFSAIDDFDSIDRILAEDVDAAALFLQTRLAGAPDPVLRIDGPAGPVELRPPPNQAAAVGPTLPPQDFARLLTQANRDAAAGNVVRAAIRRTRAGIGLDEPSLDAVADLNRLVVRLQAALQMTDADAQAFRKTLPALLPRAASGFWPAEARLLYDLQKACIDHERPVSSAALSEWAYSLFRQPLVRPLPNQALVRAVKHLRSAVGRLAAIRLPEAEGQRLSALLHDALHHAEIRLRDRLRPVLCEALRAVDIQPQSFPEHVAHDKLVEELLDRVVERGFLNIGDLRDALSRNQLKLPDLTGPAEWLTGDPLLKANRDLARRTPGVYHRGEIYLRWLQRGSSLLFGTRVGRWLTLFLLLPFGGAFATLIFIEEMLHLAHLVKPKRLTLELIVEPEMSIPLAGLGLFYLLLIHWPAFRGSVGLGLRIAGSSLHAVFVTLPAAIVAFPPVHALLQSRPWLFFVRYVLKPLPAGAIAWLALWDAGFTSSAATVASLVVFAAVSLFFNCRLGRDFEEITSDWLVRRWEYARSIVPGLFRLLVDFFRTILEAFERFLYTVDEWLRFRQGQGRLTLAGKFVLGFFWSIVAYVVRFYVNVFVEPTFNPLKHFPAVTVMAKLLVPFWIPLTQTLAAPFMFLGKPLAYVIATINLHGIPGAAGFLVWEFKENWSLYRANRRRTLAPVVIGHHGESMPRLMRPGFHSGTLPKLYAKIRRADRRAYRGGNWRTSRRLREALHHIEDALHHFTDRELLPFLSGAKAWKSGPVHLESVEAGSNRIRLVLACPALREPHLELKFEELSGWLLAHVSRGGWLEKLEEGERNVFHCALAGFYKKAGVDLVREQIEASFGPRCPPYDVVHDGLVVWPGKGYEAEVLYNLRDGLLIHPRVVNGQATVELPVLDANRLLFRNQEVTWQDWVAAWESDQAGQGVPVYFDRLKPRTFI
ncbi:MAG: hypothetical protein HY040_10570 [Planctomycetes bacterium]|nr:hypothetical protein [Planctomycetota bacterium]